MLTSLTFPIKDIFKRSLIIKKWWFRAESNHRHEDFQSSALPTELRNHLAVWTGLEPATSAVTGRHSNQLNYQTILVAGEGFEPTTFGL